MNKQFIGKAKRFLAGFVAAAMAVTMLLPIPAFAETSATTYSYDGYDVEYSVLNEWDNGQSVEVKVTNTGNESILNWALKCDVEGEISNLWNASVYANQGENYIIKNNGWNYEIAPGQTINFGYTLIDDEFEVPDNFELCSKRVEMTDGYETALNIIEQWDTGFNGELVITNISDEQIEAWTYSFDSNFIIENLWGARILESTDNHYTIASEMWTNPIAVGDSKVIGFTAALNSDITPEITNENLTHIVIDENSDTPVKPDEPEEHIIICFGEYIKDENAINVFWYSTDEGAVSLYESMDDGEWIKLAEASDEDSYKYVITDDFQAKQIKAVQETKDGIIESEPFSINFYDGEYVCTLPDDDNDGLPNIIEKIFGTDSENPDTDDDGLTDYEDVYITGTDPLKYDTDDNGINDADDDSDGDSLSNKEEIELGTDPQNVDTDDDGLSDYDEINKYNTDPLKADSDGDALKDGDEIEIGLDPNDPETFGVPDAEYKIKQTVSADSKALKRVNTEESPYKLSLEVNASGNVNGSLNADRSSYSAVVNSDIQLGETIDLKYIGGDVDEVKLNFTIGDAYLDNELNLFPDEEAIQGIKRLNIFKYFEDINMLLPIETVIDEETNTISATVDELGTYCVVDMEKWLNNLIGADMPQAVSLLSDDDDEFYIEVEETPDFSEEETRISMSSDVVEIDETSDETGVEATASVFRTAAAPYTAPYANGFTPVEAGTPVDVVFLLQAAGSLYSYFSSQIVMIKDVMDDLQNSYGKNNVRVCVITYDLSGEKVLSPNTWFTNSDDLQSALSEISYKNTSSYVNRGSAFSRLMSGSIVFKPSASKFVFQVVNGANGISPGFLSQLEACQQLSINYSEILPIEFSYDSTAYGEQVLEWIDKTNGQCFISSSSTSNDVYNHIHKYAAAPTTEYMITIASSWKKIRLKGILDPYNGIDTDEDGLTDWEEADNEQIDFNADGSLKLHTFEEIKNAFSMIIGRDVLKRFFQIPGFEPVNNVYVLPIITNPADRDSDGDGYDDISDYKPMDAFDYGFLDNELYSIGYDDGWIAKRIDTADGTLSIKNKSDADSQKFILKWCGNGYKICSCDDPDNVLSARMENGTYKAVMERDTGKLEQIWEISPYWYDESADKFYGELLFRCKKMDETSGKLESLYLSHTSNTLNITKTKDILTHFELISLGNWVRFGELMLNLLGWEHTLRDDCSSPFRNYWENKKIFEENEKNEDNINHPKEEGMKNLLIAQESDEDANIFKKLMYGKVEMYGVACEIIATYNALTLAGHEVDFVKLAAEFEYSAMLIRKNGKWGSDPKKIADCLDSYNASYDSYKTSFIATNMTRNIVCKEFDDALSPGKIAIVSYIVFQEIIKGFPIKFHIGYHTFAIKYESLDTAEPISTFNLYTKITYPYPVPSIEEALAEVNGWYYTGYILC